MGGKNNQKTGLFLSIWILVCLILVIIFFVKKDAIFSNLKETNFFERVGQKTPEFIEKYEAPEKSKKSESSLEIEVTPGPDEIGSITEVKPVIQEDEVQLENAEKENQLQIEKSATEEIQNIKNEKDSKENQFKNNLEIDKTKTKSEISQPSKQTTKVNLYFVYIDFDGTIVRKVVPRQIEKSDAPLTNTIKTLLKGPLSEEKNCISLIPEGTKLLGASVKNGIATLNFSQDFEFGGINADSYRAELMQIVFTATEFSTVKSVQFLIEGQRKDYMGSEDYQIWIGSPYSRSNFK